MITSLKTRYYLNQLKKVIYNNSNLSRFYLGYDKLQTIGLMAKVENENEIEEIKFLKRRLEDNGRVGADQMVSFGRLRRICARLNPADIGIQLLITRMGVGDRRDRIRVPSASRKMSSQWVRWEMLRL